MKTEQDDFVLRHMEQCMGARPKTSHPDFDNGASSATRSVEAYEELVKELVHALKEVMSGLTNDPAFYREQGMFDLLVVGPDVAAAFDAINKAEIR